MSLLETITTVAREKETSSKYRNINFHMGPLLSVSSILQSMLILLEICSFNHIKTVAGMYVLDQNQPHHEKEGTTCSESERLPPLQSKVHAPEINPAWPTYTWEQEGHM